MPRHLTEEDISLLSMKTFRMKGQIIRETEEERHINTFTLVCRITSPEQTDDAEETELDPSDPLAILIAREENES